MVFTDIDKQTMKALCTLVKLSEKTGANREDVVAVGQQLGVPKDDTLSLFEEWEEEDTMRLTTEEDKQRFLQYCFSFMDNGQAQKSEVKLYQKVVENLGLRQRSDN